MNIEIDELTLGISENARSDTTLDVEPVITELMLDAEGGKNSNVTLDVESTISELALEADGEASNGTTFDIESPIISAVSPEASVSKSGRTSTITITDARGTTSASVIDGTNGMDGTNGRGIESIEKTSTSGTVDTYTISLTDGETTTFDVTNGIAGSALTNTEIEELINAMV